MRILLTPLLFVVLSSAAEPLCAQPAQRVPLTRSIGGGVQWAMLPEPPVTATPGALVSWRRWSSPRVGIGSEFRWRRNTSDDGDRLSSYGFGFDVLARGLMERVSLIGGAGPGFFTDTTKDATSRTRSTFGIHAVMEMEVRATRRLSAFAGLRIEWRDLSSSESSFGYPAAGIRFAF
jgi:hypothetical protein